MKTKNLLFTLTKVGIAACLMGMAAGCVYSPSPYYYHTYPNRSYYRCYNTGYYPYRQCYYSSSSYYYYNTTSPYYGNSYYYW